MAAHWIAAGRIGVDAGIVLIADPCYVVRDPNDTRYAPYESYSALLSELTRQEREKRVPEGETLPTYQLPKELGVVVGNFGGDGLYPVYVQMNDSGRVLAITVRFDGRAPILSRPS